MLLIHIILFVISIIAVFMVSFIYSCYQEKKLYKLLHKEDIKLSQVMIYNIYTNLRILESKFKTKK